MRLLAKKILFFLCFFLCFLPANPQKTLANHYAYTIGIIADPEVFNLANTLVDSINLLNTKSFQEAHGLDKPVIFANEMLSFFMFDKTKELDIVSQAKTLQKNPHVDLILVIGMNAARLVLENNQGKKPLFLISEHDYIENNLLHSYEDSGYDNVTAFIKQASLIKQFAHIMQMLKFQKLGIIVLNSENSTSKRFTKRLQERIQKENFSLQEFPLEEDSVRAVEKLLPQIIEAKPDALIISGLESFENNVNAWHLFNTLLEKDIPCISTHLQTMTAKGALFSFSMNEAKKCTLFAQTIAKLLQKEKPRNLKMLYPYYPELNLNVIVANTLELFLNYEILSVCHHFFYSIDKGI